MGVNLTVVKFGDDASSSRSRVSLFNHGVISLAEMKSNGGEGFGALWWRWWSYPQQVGSGGSGLLQWPGYLLLHTTTTISKLSPPSTHTAHSQ